MNNYFKIVFSALLVQCSYMFSQVGIGTVDPHPSAILDINADQLEDGQKKGVLFPKLDLLGKFDNSTIPTPATGLWIYNKNAANVGEEKVFANSMYFRQPTKWEKYSSLSEIISLKQVSEFVLLSTSQHLFTAAERSTINSHTDVLSFKWNASEIVVDNPNLLVLDTNEESFTVKKEGYYQFTGMISLKTNATNETGASSGYALISVQRSTDGLAWTSIGGGALPFEYGVTDFVQTVSIPVIIEKLDLNTKIRLVISNPETRSTDYGGSAAILSNVSDDITKSLRISRIRTSAYED